MATQGIYIIKNKQNGKSYIGQSINVERRWKQHKKDMNKLDYPLYRAFKKYGFENFEFKLLEFVLITDDLTNREIFWYNKLKPDYNQIEPRESNTKRKRVYQIDLNTLKIIKEYESGLQASLETGIATTNISKVCNMLSRQSGGYAWCFVEKYNENFKPIYSNPNCRSKKILMFDLNGNLIKKFNKIIDASNYVGVHYGTVSKNCRGKQKTCKGYIFKYDDRGENDCARL